MILVEYRDPSDESRLQVRSLALPSLAATRAVVELIRTHPGVSDYAVITESGAPREVWVRDVAGAWGRDPDD